MDYGLENIDKELFAEITHGDIDAFEQLFKKYYVALCRYCEVLLDNQMDAEDVVQELFIHLWMDRRIEICGPVKTYLFSSVKHRAMNVLKYQAVRRSHSPLLAEFFKNLSSVPYSEEEIILIEKIKNVIEHLPAQCRTIFIMSCMEGKKYKEIANDLGISVNTVKSHIVKAYRDIRSAVGMKGLILFFSTHTFFKPKRSFSSQTI